MKKSILILIIVIAIIVVFAIYVIRKNKNAVFVHGTVNDSTIDDKPNYVPTPTPKPTPTAVANDAWPLKRGSKGDRVKLLQIYVGVTPDGVFGPGTEAATKTAFGKTIIDKNDLSAVIVPLEKMPASPQRSTNAQGNFFPLNTTATGYFVRLFQLAAKISVDGKFGNQSATAATNLFGSASVTKPQLQALVSNRFFDTTFPLPSAAEGSSFGFLNKLF